ncbi:unnamed protein product [Haemonchus placei]|uniref:Coat protein n=1 Tax=Haemonchus placei TaxID=6290 RepID=A0A0N4VWP9_HAEPC|nr:unnamed protein product [Haemonchus placei]
MSNMDTPEDFVEHYSTLLPDSNTSELQKVLDMRGVKKVEQTAILQAYRQVQKFGAAADAAPTVPVGMGNALSATQALNAVVSMAADGLAETTSACITECSGQGGLLDVETIASVLGPINADQSYISAFHVAAAKALVGWSVNLP